jgi:hypothetical protein
MVDVRIKDLPSRALASGDAMELDDGATAGGNRFEPSADVVTLLNAANAAGARTAISAETAGAAATAEANAIAASCQRASNLSDVTNVVTARENLGVRNVGQKRDLLRGFSFVEPFVGSVLAGGLGIISSGTGAGTSAGLAPSGGAWGTLICGTGTTATGRCSVNSVATTSIVNQTLHAGAGQILAGSRLRIAALSDGTETFLFRGGGLSDSANGDGVDAVFFRYTHTENGGNWTCVSRSNSTETATDSTVPVVANQYYWLEISVNAAGNSVDFVIDGVLCATIATNIPNGTARAFGLLPGQIVKSVGTTARNFEIDDYYFDCTFTTPRT